MAKNLVPEVCKLLGVEVREEFRIKDVNSSYTTSVHYFVDRGGRINVLDDDGGRVCGAMSLNDFLTGKVYEIIKVPWKPKDSEDFYTFMKASAKTIVVTEDEWIGSIGDLARLEAGWVYKTKEEAEAALPKVAEKLGMEYSLED